MKRLIYSVFVAMFVLVICNLGAFAADTKKCCETDCNKCITSCDATLKYFKTKGGKYATAEHLKTLQVCLDACKKAKTNTSEECCATCADACKKCATMCEDLKDPKLASCIKVCNDCAAACQ